MKDHEEWKKKVKRNLKSTRNIAHIEDYARDYSLAIETNKIKKPKILKFKK